MPEETQDRQFADEYRQIKRPLLANAFGPDSASRQPSPRLIMMASALPGDGKTFTSINLALSLARERDSSVVLVDADVAKPHVSRIFGVEREPGLLDALADPAQDLAPLILSTDVPGLSILPAGRVREGATELLSSGRMRELHAQILARHPQRVALFDSPPLVVSSESRALAATMGQVVLVVKAGHTPRQAVLDALAELPKGQQISLVLNQGRRHLLDGYYGYSYGNYGDQANA
jgi:protein-tyrosine kinase